MVVQASLSRKDRPEVFPLKSDEEMLTLNTSLKEQNVRFLIKRKKDESFE